MLGITMSMRAGSATSSFGTDASKPIASKHFGLEKLDDVGFQPHLSSSASTALALLGAKYWGSSRTITKKRLGFLFALLIAKSNEEFDAVHAYIVKDCDCLKFFLADPNCLLYPSPTKLLKKPKRGPDRHTGKIRLNILCSEIIKSKCSFCP